MTRDIGFPNILISDNSGEQTGPQIDLQEYIRRCRVDGITKKPYSTWNNRAKGMVKIIKDKAKRRIIRRRLKKHVWDFDLVWEAEIYSRTSGKDKEPLWKY